MSFCCLQLSPKNKQKQVDLRFHSSKVEFVRLFFGGNVSLKKSFWLFLTFSDSSRLQFKNAQFQKKKKSRINFELKLNSALGHINVTNIIFAAPVFDSLVSFVPDGLTILFKAHFSDVVLCFQLAENFNWLSSKNKR